MDDFLHRGIALHLHEVSGSVISSEVTTTSEISVSGGGGYIPKEGGYVRPAKLHVANKDVQELWLKLEDGAQKRYVLTNCTIPVLIGHRVLLVLGTTKGARKDILVGLWNLDAREYHAFPGGASLLWFVERPSRSHSVWLAYLGSVITLVIGFVLVLEGRDTGFAHDLGMWLAFGSVAFAVSLFLGSKIVVADRVEKAAETLRMHVLERTKTRMA